tara:strand:- start:2035 stop:2475 length:441 start_codon:yes stop_codon:yes gene_type:complete
MWWLLLAIIAAGAAIKRPRLGLPFLAALLLVVLVDNFNPHYEVQYFIAIYGGIGALLYLSGEHLAGVVLCAIGALHGLQFFGIISLHARQISGELTFVSGLAAGNILGPPVYRSDWHSVLVCRLGLRSDRGAVSTRNVGKEGGVTS